MAFRTLGSLFTIVGVAGMALGVACSSSGDDESSGSGTLGIGGGAASAGSGAGSGGGAATGAGGGSSSGGGATGAGGGSVGVLDGSAGLAGIASDLCGGEGCACSNGIDDDGDGTIDGFDAECSGPLDNDEGTFATGISGDNKDPFWQDCFFDGNSGAGDDKCRYHTDCLTGDLPADDSSCTVSDACIEFCAARTPNGCDCFGCCEVSDSGGNRINVYLEAGCSEENIDDTQACPRCEPSTQCGNECGECELCPGKTEADLPASCQPDPPPPPPVDAGAGGAPPVVNPPAYTCDNGEQVCSLEIPCASGEYCHQGCCLTIIR